MVSAQVYRFQRRIAHLQSHHELAVKRHSSVAANYSLMSQNMMDSLRIYLSENGKKSKKPKRITKPRLNQSQVTKLTRLNELENNDVPFPSYGPDCRELPSTAPFTHQDTWPSVTFRGRHTKVDENVDIHHASSFGLGQPKEPIFPPPTYVEQTVATTFSRSYPTNSQAWTDRSSTWQYDPQRTIWADYNHFGCSDMGVPETNGDTETYPYSSKCDLSLRVSSRPSLFDSRYPAASHYPTCQWQQFNNVHYTVPRVSTQGIPYTTEHFVQLDKQQKFEVSKFEENAGFPCSSVHVPNSCFPSFFPSASYECLCGVNPIVASTYPTAPNCGPPSDHLRATTVENSDPTVPHNSFSFDQNTAAYNDATGIPSGFQRFGYHW